VLGRDDIGRAVMTDGAEPARGTQAIAQVAVGDDGPVLGRTSNSASPRGWIPRRFTRAPVLAISRSLLALECSYSENVLEVLLEERDIACPAVCL
jgi:hypothetical protein